MDIAPIQSIGQLQMVLSKADATYDLSVEIGVPIELVVFESDVPVELMPADNDNAVLSLEKPNIVVNAGLSH